MIPWVQPHPLAVTTRIITFLVGNASKPYLPLVLVGGYVHMIGHLRTRGYNIIFKNALRGCKVQRFYCLCLVNQHVFSLWDGFRNQTSNLGNMFSVLFVCYLMLKGSLVCFIKVILSGRVFLSKYIKNYIPTVDGRNPANHHGMYFWNP